MTKYNKLVRDKIPEHIIGRGGVPVIHIADEKEYWSKLKEKLNEEVNEFFENEVIEEMADILEVLDAICDYKSFSKDNIDTVKSKKAEERGAFKKKIILEES